MENFKGTKGNWQITEPANGNGFIYIGKFEGDSRIATCYTVDENSINGEITSETKANALLISKAPELLDHLKNLIDDMSSLLSELEDRGFEWQQAGYYNSSKELIKSATEF